MLREMTELQDQIYSYLIDTIKEKGYPPSVREIASAVGLNSPSSVQLQLNKLIDMGYISKDPETPRGIKINDEKFNLSLRKTIDVPILKDTTNFDTLFSETNIASYMPILEESVGNSDFIMFEFKGNSMENVAILDKDWLLIRKQETADSEDLVMVYANNSIMIRRLIKDNLRYRLLTESKVIEETVVERLKIIGKVVGVYRKIG